MTDADISRQLASLTRELAISSGRADEYLRERTRLYAIAQKLPSDFDIGIEGQLASWIVKLRLDETTTSPVKRILRKFDQGEEREQAAKVPDLESQVRRFSELYGDVQDNLTSERRATSEYVARNLKSLNDFYGAYQEFRPGEHKSFQERLDLHLGSDPISVKLKELFSIPTGEEYDIEKSIIDNMVTSVYKIIPFLQDENERAAKAVATVSRKAVKREKELEDLRRKVETSKNTLGPLLERQRDRLDKVKTAVEPLMKLYAGQFKSSEDNERVFECLAFVVDDLQKKADEIGTLTKAKSDFARESVNRGTSLDEIYGLVQPVLEMFKQDSTVAEPVNAVRLAMSLLEQRYANAVDEHDTLKGAHAKLTSEAETAGKDAYDTVEKLRKELERLEGVEGKLESAEKQRALYERNFGTRVDEEVAQKVGDIDQRIEAFELSMARKAEEYESEYPPVAIDLYTQIITNTIDQKRKAECLYLRGRVRRKYAGQPDEGIADMQEAYKLNNDEAIKKVLDTLTTA